MTDPAVATPEIQSPPAEVEAPTRAPAHDHRYHGLRAIEPVAPGIRRWLPEWWRHRTSVAYFLLAYMRKRYGRTFLGYIWLFLPIVLPLILSSLVFGGILGVKVPGGVPYFLFFTITTAIWTLFAGTAYYSTRSLEITRSQLRKTYIPRLVPWSAAFSLASLNFVVYGVIGTGAVIFYLLTRGTSYLSLRPATLLAPVAVVMMIVFGLAVGLWFSPLAPRARDVRRLAGYVIGMWYMLTPVIYPIEKIPSSYRFLAELNPVTAPVEMFKSALLGSGGVTATGLASYAVGLILIGSIGLRMFLVKERRDVDWYY
jgi:lipopolysaccharide transport system permease protein